MLIHEKRVIFCDLDGTLIQTVSGATFPQGIWDMKFRMDVWAQLKRHLDRLTGWKYVAVVSNQGGVGKYVSHNDFMAKMVYVDVALTQYLGDPENTNVKGYFCPSNDRSNPDRKPNPGMLAKFLENVAYECGKSHCWMIGDASGRPGNHSDDDKKCAENFGIDYCDVEDFLKFQF